MLLRKTGNSSEHRVVLTSEILAIGVAAGLVLGLFAALIGGSFLAGDTRLIGSDGCTHDAWRNPVTGRIETVGAGLGDWVGAPPCR